MIDLDQKQEKELAAKKIISTLEVYSGVHKEEWNAKVKFEKVYDLLDYVDNMVRASGKD